MATKQKKSYVAINEKTGRVTMNDAMKQKVRQQYAERQRDPAKKKEFEAQSKRNTEDRIRDAFYDNGDFSGGQKEAQRLKKKSQEQRRMAEYERSRRRNLK